MIMVGGGTIVPDNIKARNFSSLSGPVLFFFFPLSLLRASLDVLNLDVFLIENEFNGRF